MKIIFNTLFFVLFFFADFSQAQNWIQNYDGIPVHTGLWWGWTNEGRYPGAIDSMKKIVDIVSTDIGVLEREAIDPLNQINYLKLKGLKLIPVRSRTGEASQLYNWIQHYTDAKYCVWEAEGTSTTLGDATLEYNSSVMTEYTDGDTTYLKLNLNAAGLKDTNLIWGPYYVQDAVYYASQDSSMPLIYTANFRLKLDYINGIPNGNDNPNDSVCIVQVSYSTPQGTQGLACTQIVEQDTIIRSRLKSYFQDFQLVYDLDTSGCDGSSTNEIPQQNTFHSSTRRDTLLPGPRNGKEYVEFRVVWLGKPQYLLSIDNVTLSDIRGRELFLDPFREIHRQKIKDQANTSDSLNADTVIVGWLGIDEPVSIDIFEPIKLVTQLLDDNSQNTQPLWLALMGKYDGAFRNRDDIHGAMGLSPWAEMKKRIGNMNVWQDFYLYDYPCNENSTESICQGDWRSINIWRMAELNYKQAYELNPNFGVSLQCGEIHNTQAYERNIEPHELLYNSNIALMYGAKFLSLYSYFAQRDTTECDSGWTCHAIVDIIPCGTLNYTPKYYMLKNILKPRLDGLFGKTIKNLVPTEQHLNIDASSYYNFISHFSGNLECLPSTSDYDLGFFTDSLSRDYFMLISRYYNQSGACPIYINFDESSLNNNLVLTKFAEDTTYNILRSDPIPVNLTRGDAELYRIYPVVRWGGQLLANDTIYTNTTLTDPMSISAGAKLFIKAGKFYTIQDTVILNGTGQQPNWGFITGDGYLDVAQGGEVIANNWAYSLFKGKQSNHPKLFWSKFTGSDHTGYKIYRKKETQGFVEIATLSNTARTYIDTTVVVIDGQSQSNEVVAEYYVKAIYNNGRSSSNSNTITYKRVEGSAWEKLSTVLTRDNFTYQLQQNYPNPFNPVTQISYSIENDGLVELEVLNILGERVASLVNEYKTKGSYTIPFDASQLSSGIYIYRLRSKDFVSSKKMILLK
jgi:hypothetical protein